MSETHICPECNGKGEVRGVLTDSGWQAVPCANCDGAGWLDEHGEPIPLENEVKEPSNEQ